MANSHRLQETCQETFNLIKDLKVPLLSKLTVLSAFTPSLPNLILIATFLWSQIQLFFVVSRGATLSLFNSDFNYATQYLDNIDDNFFFGNIFDFPNYPRLTMALLNITFIYLVLTTFGFVYILLALKNRAPFFPFIQRLMKILIDLHPYILFYPIHINMIKLLYSSIDQGQDEALKLPAKIFSLVVLVYNISFTVTLTIWFTINTKTKHPFTSKTNLIAMLDLALKTIVPFLFYKGSLSDSWSIILMIGIILYCRLRDWVLFRYLPYYRVCALKIATIVHALLSSYVIALGLGRVFHWAREDWDQYNVTVLFLLIFGPIFIKLWTAHINRIQVKVLLKPSSTKNTYHLLHYYEICKDFVSFKETGITQRRINLQYMNFVNSLIQSENAAHFLKELTQDWNVAKQKQVNKYFLKKSMDMITFYLKKSSERLWLAKLTLARYYSKYETNYAQASHIIDEGFDSNIFQRNSFLYIKVKILNQLKTKSQEQQVHEKTVTNLQTNHQPKLSVGEFIRLQETFKKIQKDFIKSISFHIEFWRHFQLPKPDLLKLLSLAQISKDRSHKLKYVTQAAKLFAQHNFPEPLLTCGLYFHYFQYEMATAQAFIRDFFQLELKNKDQHQNHNHFGFGITQEQFGFTSESIYFVVSPAQNSLGKILDCSGRVGSVLGIPKDLLVGQSVNTLIPPSFAKYHDNFLRAQQQQSSSSHSVINKTREITTLMKDGYIASAHLHIALTHVRNYELCYYSLLEPIKDDTRLLLIANNGLMSSCSRNFAEDLGIIDYTDKDSVNIWDICPDFGNITTAAKRKLGSVLKSIRNLKRTSLGHVHLNNISKALTKSPKTSLVLSEDAHSHVHSVEHNKHEIDCQENGHYVRTISVRETQLSFFPCWYRTPQDREGVEPLIFQARIRKFEVTGLEMVEVKMKKVSNFSFVPPAILRQNNLKSLKTAYLSPTKTNYMETLSPRNTTTRTENAPLVSPQGSARSIFPIPLKLSPRFAHLMNCDTLDSPHLIKELIIQEDEQSPDLKRKKSTGGRARGDDDGLDEFYSAKTESTVENKKTETKLKGLLNMDNMALDKDMINEEADLLGNIMLSSTDGGTGAAFENAKNVRNQKILKSILESKQRRNETLLYIFSFVFTSVALLFLLIWLNFYTTTISEKVSKYSDVLQSSYFRSYWTIIGTQATLYWAGAVLQWVHYADVQNLTGGFERAFRELNNYNQLLESSLSDVDHDILELAYVKNVRIYDRDQNNERKLVGIDNTFQATERVINQGFTNLYLGLTFLTELNKETMFLIDNSLNDLQVHSVPLTEMIKEKLFAIFGDSRNTMIKVIGGVFGVVLLFIIFSVKYIVQANAEFKRFANVLFTLQASDIKEIEQFAITFKEILEKDIEARELLINLFDLKKNQQENDRNVKHQNTMRKTFDPTKADNSVKRIYARNYALFLGLIVFTGFTIGFTTVYYTQASGKLTIMETQHNNINSALTYVNDLAWITTEIQLAPLLNFTVGTRNRPINETMIKDIEALRDVATLQKSLKNQKGEYTPAMEKILFDFPCKDAYSPYYTYNKAILSRNCRRSSDGQPTLGLVELTSRIGMVLAIDCPQFFAGPKDLASLKAFYYLAFYDYGVPMDVEFVLLLLAYEAAEADFEELIESLADLQVTLAWIAVTISLGLCIFVWIFVIRKLARLELEIKELILLIPSRVIMKNLLLKRYIVMMVRSESAKDQAFKLLR